MKPICLVFIYILCLCANNITSDETNKNKTINFSIKDNSFVNAELVSCLKTKNSGYSITIKFTNKTNKDIYGMATDCYLYEDDWLIFKNYLFKSYSASIMIPKNGSANIVWTDGIASSINKVVLEIKSTQ